MLCDRSECAFLKNRGRSADNTCEDEGRIPTKELGVLPHKNNLSIVANVIYCVDTMINYTVETDREDDGRWIAEIPELPGVMVYGDSQEEAIKHVQALAFRVLADQIERSEHARAAMTVNIASAA
jgi:predicted RNase H-like HicB family nuclease